MPLLNGHPDCHTFYAFNYGLPLCPDVPLRLRTLTLPRTWTLPVIACGCYPATIPVPYTTVPCRVLCRFWTIFLPSPFRFLNYTPPLLWFPRTAFGYADQDAGGIRFVLDAHTTPSLHHHTPFPARLTHHIWFGHLVRLIVKRTLIPTLPVHEQGITHTLTTGGFPGARREQRLGRSRWLTQFQTVCRNVLP